MTNSSTLSEIGLSQELLVSARNSLLGQDPPERGVILAENISLESFQNFCETEPKLPVKIRLVNGTIVAYEVTLTPHGSAVCNVNGLAYDWSKQLLGAFAEDLIVGPNSYFIADLTFRPRRLPPPPPDQACNSSGYAYPNMVVEVGYIESIQSLHELAPFYLSQYTTIMIYLAIKLYPSHTHQSGEPGVSPMVAMLYQRTSQTPYIPTRIISFGDAPLHNSTVDLFINMGVPSANFTGFGRQGAPPCNAFNLPVYQLPIPADEIFHRTPSILPDIVFNLDLWKVLDRIINP
ncbi:uncharacterized protein OCT59_007715 [Rhizophagus irregularis]|uniref:Uncharacterized protein n=2 Tax=Rhizophagus irregularis TaxID=588596 RepID=A0A015L0D9_RHIIW|nr:hypothetical protein GLOIN_2v1768213 [Rhizophagus irregularis DAOM 181602=DAOM 197198]EXX73309.1 hypothetical protein RirG_061400 [Rhizophagus irregularis DAOM 197198w]UZO16326.1 hypothetical protein OCT59_007715 [Rhizophagus irregularis]POG77173.1 hypothetical protein GLOIN_2v1768213 [Rhizophagus irregularis DAOM 181602=DAOM 197198]CAG8649511.1 1571_t:CDS:2 [Rhizophagus irregularis]GBC33593.1 hypothetical protein GLOIN_2v1768213 [Rhizophagus irregularis DAOM 181602=DAOM 197198]|eukprot:XP_025184039.1 hypothetical protein GLOIN_2v1768213 [Rhizophagus irregularis DAOM 181602=DAOM 197198]